MADESGSPRCPPAKPLRIAAWSLLLLPILSVLPQLPPPLPPVFLRSRLSMARVTRRSARARLDTILGDDELQEVFNFTKRCGEMNSFVNLALTNKRMLSAGRSSAEVFLSSLVHDEQLRVVSQVAFHAPSIWRCLCLCRRSWNDLLPNSDRCRSRPRRNFTTPWQERMRCTEPTETVFGKIW